MRQSKAMQMNKDQMNGMCMMMCCDSDLAKNR